MEDQRPLIVDLDGSLLRTDTLHEAVAAGLRHPVRLLNASATLGRSGKAAMKQVLAVDGVDLRQAPLNASVVNFVHRRMAGGGRVFLVTGADRMLADQVASRIPGLSGVMASDGTTNLIGPAKTRVLVERFGERGFDYIGNSRADLDVWARSGGRYLATLRPEGEPGWARDVDFDEVLRDASPNPLRTWARALRVHQSLKNVLIFLPLVAAHEFTNPGMLLAAIGAFIAFTLMAFGVYLLNDTLDLAADRAHHTKYRRPIAAGWVSPLTAVFASGVLTVAAIALGALLGLPFLVVLLVYAVATTSYSFWLKRIAVIDVVVLALLYMVRIVAGAVVTGIALSFWFTAVTLFLFLSLALVKRYAEAHESRERTGEIPGRGYSGEDVHAILALGSATGIAAVLLAAVYIQSDAVSDIYPSPTALWLVIPTAFYWVANLWLKAGRGQMHDDPLIFALRDRASLAASAVILLAFVAASVPVVEQLIPGGQTP